MQMAHQETPKSYGLLEDIYLVELFAPDEPIPLDEGENRPTKADKKFLAEARRLGFNLEEE